MSNVLLIHSSVFGEKSQSLGLARDFLKRYPHRSLVERALAPHTMPHLDGETFAAMGTDAKASAEEMAALVRALGRIAREQGVAQTGYRILANTGPAAHQEVPHFHVHLFGGRDLGGMLPRR